MHRKSTMSRINSLITFVFISTFFAGCSLLALTGEEVADEVIEHEIVPEVEKEINKEIEKESKKDSQRLPRSTAHLVFDYNTK